MKSKINKIGFEIEGEFSEELYEKLLDIGDFHSDGSIRYCSSSKIAKYHSNNANLMPREFVTNPIPFNNEGKKEVNKIFKIMNSYKKKKEYHYNSSMGFHIHVSFKPTMPVEIWSSEFAEFFWNKMQVKFKSASKKRENNSFCKVDLNNSEIANYHSSRYKFINFGPAYTKHKTIEFRIFPSQKPLTMKKYLNFTIDTINEFLENCDNYLKEEFSLEVENKNKKEESVSVKVEKLGLTNEKIIKLNIN